MTGLAEFEARRRAGLERAVDYLIATRSDVDDRATAWVELRRRVDGAAEHVRTVRTLGYYEQCPRDLRLIVDEGRRAQRARRKARMARKRRRGWT